MRLQRAIDDGLVFGETTVVFAPDPDLDVSLIPNATIISQDFVAHKLWKSRGYPVDTQTGAVFDTAVVCVPRSKILAKHLVSLACQRAQTVVVDGQKTDGVESLFKAVRNKTQVDGVVTKSHGRLFWFATGDFSDWADQPKIQDGYETRAGVFSAEKIDPASALLASHIPNGIKGNVADFGAGWGFLAKHVLGQDTVQSLSLIENNLVALDCARRNITDDRATFIWGDATQTRGPFDHIIMNPPFHIGRADRPDLGQAFIQSAAKSLHARGTLWMVANRHLPYESTLDACFGQVKVLCCDGAFKVFEASRPKRK